MTVQPSGTKVEVFHSIQCDRLYIKWQTITSNSMLKAKCSKIILLICLQLLWEYLSQTQCDFYECSQT